MLKEVTFDTFLKEYTCFEDANYVRIIMLYLKILSILFKNTVYSQDLEVEGTSKTLRKRGHLEKYIIYQRGKYFFEISKFEVAKIHYIIFSSKKDKMFKN